MKAQRGSKGIAVSFINLGATWEYVVNAMPRPIYPRKIDPIPIVQEAGWGPTAGLDECGKPRSDRDSIPRSSSP